jgi:DNA repair exonuclease SbcCD ATPase subunit
MRIFLRKIKWKNFLSTGEAFSEIELDKCKSTILVGNNGNGKSQSVDAIVFALYGKSYRRLSGKLGLINSTNKKNCVVEIEFTINGIEYKVVRGLKPAIFDIYVAGEKLLQQSSLLEQQKYLETNILKVEYKTFCQIVILGSGRYISFMELPAKDRREIIEEILDIGVFSSMNLKLKDDIVNNEKLINDADNDVLKITYQKESLEKYIDKVSKDNVEKNNDIKIDIEKLEYKNKELYCQLEIKSNYLGELEDSCQSQIDKYTLEIKKISKIIIKSQEAFKYINSNIEFYTNHQLCPTCSQEIEKGFSEEKIFSMRCEKEKIERKLKEYKDKLKTLENNLTDKQTESKSLIKIRNEISEIRSNINYNNSLIKKNRDILKNSICDVNIDKSVGELKNCEFELDRLNECMFQLNYEKTKFQYAKKLLQDDGIKSRIVDNFLSFINERIANYLSLFEFSTGFVLDRNFDEKILSQFKDDLSYGNFSAGEKLRIDVSLLLMLRDLSKEKNSISVNVLFMDEILDGSLDCDGIDSLLPILTNLVDTNVFIISHKTENMIDYFDRVLCVSKINEFSMIEEK